VSEGPTWTAWHHKLAYKRDCDEELVLEIIVAPTKSKMKRSIPWTSVKEACLPLMDMVDWNRSMPYSIQEIRHSLGVETAYEMVTRARFIDHLMRNRVAYLCKRSLNENLLKVAI